MKIETRTVMTGGIILSELRVDEKLVARGTKIITYVENNETNNTYAESDGIQVMEYEGYESQREN
jgi:hypothetical protein